MPPVPTLLLAGFQRSSLKGPGRLRTGCEGVLPLKWVPLLARVGFIFPGYSGGGGKSVLCCRVGQSPCTESAQLGPRG